MSKEKRRIYLLALSSAVASLRRREAGEKIYFILLALPITETMNNKCLIGQECHNNCEPITVVPELKRYVRNNKTTYDN